MEIGGSKPSPARTGTGALIVQTMLTVLTPIIKKLTALGIIGGAALFDCGAALASRNGA